MRHPFDGLNIPAPSGPELLAEPDDPLRGFGKLDSHRSTRRGFVGKLFGFSAAVAAAWEATAAQAQQRGQAQPGGAPGQGSSRGGSSRSGRSPSGSPSGGSMARNGRPTTYALGEEGGGPPPNWDGRVTTQALGEEGGRYPRPWPGATTYALGEEGGYYPPPYYRYPYYGYYRPPWWYR